MADVGAEAIAQAHKLFSTVLEASGVDVRLAETLAWLLHEADAVEQPGGNPSLLPVLACAAIGGEPLAAVPVAAAWRGLHLASKLFDDLQDGDVDRLQAGPGSSGHLLNLGTALYASSILCLSHFPAHLYTDITPLFHTVILQMANGQERELAASEGKTVEECLSLIGQKAGSFFALGAEAGSRCATDDASTLSRMRQFGYNAGVALQIADDLEGFRNSSPNGDLANGRLKLPVLYALSVASWKERLILEKLLGEVDGNTDAQSKARHLVRELGAETYMLMEMARHRNRAMHALAESFARPDYLHRWLLTLTCSSGQPSGIREPTIADPGGS